MTKKNNHGFTLVEAIVSLALLSIIAIACLSIFSSGISAKNRNMTAVREQIALRQALLTVTREIRKYPKDTDPLGPIDERYKVIDGMLRRNDGSAVARGVAYFDINIPPDNPDDHDNHYKKNKVTITVKSASGQEVTTAIYLRIDMK